MLIILAQCPQFVNKEKYRQPWSPLPSTSASEMELCCYTYRTATIQGYLTLGSLTIHNMMYLGMLGVWLQVVQWKNAKGMFSCPFLCQEWQWSSAVLCFIELYYTTPHCIAFCNILYLFFRHCLTTRDVILKNDSAHAVVALNDLRKGWYRYSRQLSPLHESHHFVFPPLPKLFGGCWCKRIKLWHSAKGDRSRSDFGSKCVWSKSWGGRPRPLTLVIGDRYTSVWGSSSSGPLHHAVKHLSSSSMKGHDM